MTDKKTLGIAAVIAKMTLDTHPVLFRTFLNAATMASGNCPTFGGAD
jgi:hypothetical protein